MRLANATYRGETRTAYQIHNARAQAIGYRSYGEYLKVRRDYAPKWEKHRDQMLAAGVPPGKLGAFSSAERLWYEIDQERGRLPRNAIGQTNDHDSELLRDPEGPLAQILVMMGYRDKESNTPPGDSPIRHK